MADLEQMNVAQLLQFLNANANRADDAGRRLDALIGQFKQRNDAFSQAIGRLQTRDKQDEYRIDDLVELRDKINDGFGVLEENEEYQVENKARALDIVGQLLIVLERAQDFLQACLEQFSRKDEDQIQAEGEEIRWLIRFVDQNLADAHVRHLAAYLGIAP